MPPTAVYTLAIAALLSGCAKKGAVEPAAEPRRPEPEPVVRDDAPAPNDCRDWTPEDLPASWTYEQRVVDQAKNLASEGFERLRAAEKSSLPRPRRETLITEAVDKFILALKSDPYNVHATYNLAAAYARIGRDQCALNLLERLADLHQLPSQKKAVEAKVDRLLGRGRYENDMDPDFHALRGDSRFIRLVRKF